MAERIELYPLGIGDYRASRLWHNSFALHVDGSVYVIDCPKRIEAMLQDNHTRGEWPLTLADYRVVLLTHLHRDHAGGLVELVQSGAINPARPMRLYAPPVLLDQLWVAERVPGIITAASFPGGIVDLNRFFQPMPIDDLHEFCDFHLSYRLTQHIPNTFAYRFDFGNFRLGYSADSAYDPDLIQWLDGCDAVLHEVLVPPGASDEVLQTLHTPLSRLLSLPVAFQQKTFLCHVDENTYLEHDPGMYRYLEQHRIYCLKC